MADAGPNAVVERFWRLMEARDWAAARALLAPDFVADWPQSSERFPSPDAFMSMNEAHPAPNWHIISVSVLRRARRLDPASAGVLDRAIDRALAGLAGCLD